MNAHPSQVDFGWLADLEVGDQFEVTFKYRAQIIAIDGLLRLIDGNVITSLDMDKLKSFILNDHRWLPGQNRSVRLCVKDRHFAYRWDEVQKLLEGEIEALKMVSRTRDLINRSDINTIGNVVALRFKPDGTAGIDLLLQLCERGYFELVERSAALDLLNKAKQTSWRTSQERKFFVVVKQSPCRMTTPGADFDTYQRLEENLEILRTDS